MPNLQRQLMTTKQVAEAYGKSVSTVGRQARKGVIPSVHKLDGETGAYLFDPEEIARHFAPQPDEAAA